MVRLGVWGAETKEGTAGKGCGAKWGGDGAGGKRAGGGSCCCWSFTTCYALCSEATDGMG